MYRINPMHSFFLVNWQPSSFFSSCATPTATPSIGLVLALSENAIELLIHLAAWFKDEAVATGRREYAARVLAIV